MSTIEHEPVSHHLPPAVVAHQQRRVVQFFILADAVVFGCLLFSYYYLRSLNVDGGWLPSGAQTAQTWLVWVITGVTVLSAIAYRSAETAIRGGQRSRFLTGALIGVILVVLALGLMIYQARTWPILMSDGSYASMFIVMVGMQIVHLVILLIIGIGIWNRGTKGKLDDGNYNHAVLVGYFWYWVTLTSVLGALTTLTVS